jgi:hypothetical protein
MSKHDAECRICAAAARPFATAKVLRKYDVRWFECPSCGFVQSEEPYWLAEAYSDPIADIDLGSYYRCDTYSKITKSVILSFFDPAARFVDYGGGYGLFVRAMRDKGFDFSRQDSYCRNLFAQGFDVKEAPAKKFELLTAWEVFEHLADPSAEVERMLGYSDNFFFTTELLPAHRPKPGDWWYYALNHGQHISIYTLRSLEVIAERHGLHLRTDGERLHLLSKKRVSGRKFSFVTRPRTAAWIDLLRQRPTLLWSDFEAGLARDGQTPPDTGQGAAGVPPK